MNKQRLYWVDMLRILEDEKSQEQLQKIEITKNKIIATICVIGLGLAILPLIIASFSNHLYADDYSYGCNGMNILNQNLGLIETIQKLIGNAIITTYDQWYNWSGCYTSFFFSSISPGIFGDEWIFVNVFILLGSFVLSNYIGFRIFLGDILKVDKIKVLQLFCVVTFISIQFVPSIPQAFYWFNGAFYNIVGYSLGLLQFAFVLKLLFKKEISYVHRNGIATILIGILFGGTNYSCILLYMVIYLYLFIYLLLQKKYKKISDKYAILAMVIFYICSFLNIAAPGNFQRQHAVGDGNSAVGAIYQAIISVVPFVVDNINMLQVALISLSIPVVYECTKKIKFTFKYPGILFIMSYLALAVCFTPTCYALNSLGPDRTQNVYYFLLILLIYINIFYVCGWINHKIRTDNKNFSGYKCVEVSVGIMLIVLILLSKDGIMSMSSAVAAKELINGDLKAFDEQATERYLIYTNPDIKKVALEPLTVNPACLTVNPEQNISTDPEWWVNQVLCSTYDKDILYIKSE